MEDDLDLLQMMLPNQIKQISDNQIKYSTDQYDIVFTYPNEYPDKPFIFQISCNQSEEQIDKTTLLELEKYNKSTDDFIAHFSQYYTLSSKKCQKQQKRQIIDSHNHFLPCYYKGDAHLSQETFDQDLSKWKGINDSTMIIVCTIPEKISEAQEITHQNHFFYSVSIHPNHIRDLIEDKVVNYSQQLEQEFQIVENHVKQICKTQQNLFASNLVAIGETGLSSSDKSILNIQKRYLQRHLDLSLKYNLRCIIHAHREEELQILIDLIYDNLSKYKQIKLIIHGFSANIKQLEELLKFDTYFSFNSFSLHRSQTFVRKTINKVGTSRLLVETDSPFNIVKKNEPSEVNDFVVELSELIGVQTSDLIKITNQNAINAYQLDKYQEFNQLQQ